MSTPAYLHARPDSLLLSVRLQPRASANEIGESQGAELKIRVTAAPVDDAANDALVRLLAKVLDCGRNQIELVRGHTSRHKVVRIVGLSENIVASKLSVA